METGETIREEARRSGFKSHHSGMETGPTRIRFYRRYTLNRTIVGWKRQPEGHGVNFGFALNRTIVGWKRREGAAHIIGQLNFKSHHSGMETKKAVACSGESRPL